MSNVNTHINTKAFTTMSERKAEADHNEACKIPL